MMTIYTPVHHIPITIDPSKAFSLGWSDDPAHIRGCDTLAEAASAYPELALWAASIDELMAEVARLNAEGSAIEAVLLIKGRDY